MTFFNRYDIISKLYDRIIIDLLFTDILKALLDALIDSLKILPVLFVVYLIIEWVEYKKYNTITNSSVLSGKLSPIIGALFGTVPQCGFSVAATDLFAAGRLSAGALVAVYISTSDEALPILIANPKNYKALLLLIACKIVLGIAVGYLTYAVFPLIFKEGQKKDEDEHDSHHSAGCCHHDIEGNGKFEWHHPILHCLKIFAYILAVNVVMSLLILFIGEEAIQQFLLKSRYLQPIVALLIGLLPNCASSVILTEVYLLGGFEFSAVLCGLMANAGLGFMVLYKENHSVRENLFITFIVSLSAIIVGYAGLFIRF